MGALEKDLWSAGVKVSDGPFRLTRSASFAWEGRMDCINVDPDSRVYIWRRQTGVQVAALDGHGDGTVNAVAWHPTNPAVFASAGDDRRVRMYADYLSAHLSF